MSGASQAAHTRESHEWDGSWLCPQTLVLWWTSFWAYPYCTWGGWCAILPVGPASPFGLHRPERGGSNGGVVVDEMPGDLTRGDAGRRRDVNPGRGTARATPVICLR